MNVNKMKFDLNNLIWCFNIMSSAYFFLEAEERSIKWIAGSFIIIGVFVLTFN